MIERKHGKSRAVVLTDDKLKVETKELINQRNISITLERGKIWGKKI